MSTTKATRTKLEFKSASLKERLNYTNKAVVTSLTNIDVVFGYGKKRVHAVKDFSLNIFKGEILGLIGESGSGKSTIANVIMGLIKRKAGSLKILATEIPKNNNKIKGKLYQFTVNKTQMIFQDPTNSLNPYKNIFKIISEGLDNVDIVNAYQKIFDLKTLTNLSKMFQEVKTKPSKLLEIETWLKTSSQDYHSKFKLEYYQTILKQLQKIVSKLSFQAQVYLKIRLHERQYLFTSKSQKNLKKHLVIETLNLVGLTKQILGRYPLEFSSGQQQRIGICRAIVLQPSLLVADEPISSLDVSIQAQVVNIFNDLKAKLNLTILFIAHDLRMVEYISDRVAVMYRGRLVEVGNTNEITQFPIHPYTTSLLEAVPTIKFLNKKVSLNKLIYDPQQHDYSPQNQPSWFQIGNKNHFVFGTKIEIENWINISTPKEEN